MAKAEHAGEPHTTTHNDADDVVAMIEEKREAIERLAESEYALATHAEALLQIANTDG